MLAESRDQGLMENIEADAMQCRIPRGQMSEAVRKDLVPPSCAVLSAFLSDSDSALAKLLILGPCRPRDARLFVLISSQALPLETSKSSLLPMDAELSVPWTYRPVGRLQLHEDDLSYTGGSA